ncbi:hypothetical protein [Phyllobacterium myrsinacearum]|uniref:Uncharacterized protein n=1 Tax=Phyllobacterium myrsinacearum TaxID=28101 RepID=A0A839EWH2_9HYPH|nr:hypothetical protein [Phyllobacterium myrsinacearum]MBA8881656.1 hypothetical protein [Phyllobacterium myrsinacearum]
MNRQRIEYATEGFLSAMRREFLKLHPADPCPIKRLADYSPAHRSALMNAIGISMRFGEKERDKDFDAWMKKRAEDVAAANDA